MTQKCSYESADPLACFAQLFIAHFNYAFVFIDPSHTDFVCVQVHMTSVC